MSKVVSLISKERGKENGLVVVLDVEKLVEVKGFKFPLEEPLSSEPLECPNTSLMHESSFMTSKSLSSSKVDFITSKGVCG